MLLANKKKNKSLLNKDAGCFNFVKYLVIKISLNKKIKIILDK